MTTRDLSFILLLGALVLGGCASEAPEPPDPTATYESFGVQILPEGAVPVQAVLAEPENYVGRIVKIEGTVREVCQNAGCWLTMDAGEGPLVRILVDRDEDGGYAFTVPKDIGGRRAIARGILEEQTLDDDERRHLAEDTGADYVPAFEYRIEATGVLVEKVRG
jgi:hypothetical protein